MKVEKKDCLKKNRVEKDASASEYEEDLSISEVKSIGMYNIYNQIESKKL
jgi:hypothetical protein